MISFFAKNYLKNRTKENSSGCWEWQKSGDKSGYGMIKHRFFGPKFVYVHRAMWLAHGKEIPEGMILLHSCDNPKCCNPEHLSLGTLKENTQDMLKKDRQSSKLKQKDVKIVRDLLQIGMGMQDIADKFDVSYETIRLIKEKRTWTHI